MTELSDPELIAIDQIQRNAAYWHSEICKRMTLVLYIRNRLKLQKKIRGAEEVEEILNGLIRKGIVYTPYTKSGYVGLIFTDWSDNEKYEVMDCGKRFLRIVYDCCRGEPLNAKYPQKCLDCKRFVP